MQAIAARRVSRYRPTSFLLSLTCLALWLVALPTVARAQVSCTVNALTDTGTGTGTSGDLRYCVGLTNASASTTNTITISASGTIPLTSELKITQSVVIEGPGAKSLIISGENASRALYINTPGITVQISDVTFANGNSSSYTDVTKNYGGAILSADDLQLTRVAFVNNTTGAGAAGNGGAVYEETALTLTDCTFTGNSAGTGNGGGVALNNGATPSLTATRTTFSGNTAGYGSSIYIGTGTAGVTNSTFAGNYASTQGGILLEAGTLTVGNSTFSGNASPQGPDIDDAVASAGSMTVTNSIFMSASGCYTSGSAPCPSDGTGGNLVAHSGVELLPLGYYGGMTESMMPLPTSTSLCAGTTSALTMDQREFPMDPSCGTGAADSGSVQANYTQSVTTTADSGGGSLRDAITADNAATYGTVSGYGDINATGVNGTIALASELPTVTGYVNIIGPGADKLAIAAATSNRIIYNQSGTLSFYGMTLKNGNSSSVSHGSGYGGAILSGAPLTLVNSAFTNNTAGTGGNGGAVFESTTNPLVVTNCSFTNNFSPGGLGGAIRNDGPLTVTNSTFSGNTAMNGSAIYDNTFDGSTSAYDRPLPATIQYSTFANNDASNLGAVWINSGEYMTVQNSTFLGNTATGGAGAGLDNNGNQLTLTNSLFDQSAECVSSGAACPAGNGNVFGGAGLLLAPLGNNGGPTQTVLPLPDSTSICAGSAALIPTAVTTDQRGFANTNSTYSASTCVDSGAVQTNYTSVQFVNPPVTPATYAGTVNLAGTTPPVVVSVTENGQNIGGVPVTLTFTGTGTATGTAATDTVAGTGATFSDLTVNQTGTDQISVTLPVTSTYSLTAAAQTLTINSTGAATTTVAAAPIPSTITVSPTDQTIGVAATVTLTSGGTAVTAGQVMFTVTNSGGTTIGTPVAGTMGGGGTWTATYTIPGGTVAGAYTVTASYTDPGGNNPSTGSASLTIQNYLLTIVSNNTAYGTVNTSASGYYAPNSSVPLVATAKAGYYFTGWTPTTGITDAASANTTITVNSTETVTGNFAPIPSYVVSVNTDTTTGTAANCPGTNCSLRDALAAAASAGAGTITFDPTTFASASTITLTNGTLTVPTLTTITGPTTGGVTVDGGSASTVFTVNSGATGVSMANLTITGGSGANGGGINNSGTLTVMGCTISTNSASGNGGGISNAGTLTVTDSTITGNSAPGGGGGIYSGSGSLTIADSTVDGNHATGGSGGGVDIAGGTATMNNTIVAANTATNDPDGAGTATGNNNLIGDATGLTLTGSNNQEGTSGTPIDANLATLGNYGGPTSTMIPLPGSPAICAGASASIAAGVTTDQRGEPNTNTTYTGFTSTACVDEGAVQTNYSLHFSTPVSNVVQYSPMTPAPAVTLEESGKTFTAGSATIGLTLTPAGTISGNSASSSSGVATYSNLVISTPGTGDTLTANLTLNAGITPTAPSISVPSGTFNVTVAVSQLAFTSGPPATLTAGGNAGTVMVSEENTGGTVVTGASDTITLTVTGPGSYLKTYTQAASSGIATFDLSTDALNTAGAYTYKATSGSITEATASETVSAAAAATISVVSGSGQSTVIGQAFAAPLMVKVEDSFGNAISGATVSFTAPASGPSATFSAPAATDASGETSVTATANGLAGITSYTVSAGVSGVTTPGSFTLTNEQATTTLALTSSPGTPVYGQPITLGASISPGSILTSTPTGKVTFSEAGNALTPASTVAGAAASYVVDAASVGVHSFSASYSGDTNFKSSSTTALTTVTVGKASSSLSVPTSPVTLAYGAGGSVPITVAGQFSGTGIAPPSGDVTYTIGSGTAQTAAIASGVATVMIPTTQAAGTVTVTVNYGGDGNYMAAAPRTFTLTVTGATLTVMANNATRAYGVANPTFTGSVTGAINGDTFTEGFTTGATTDSAPGTYPIVPSVTGTNVSDYSVVVVNGTLTVTKADTATSLSANSASVNPGASVTLTATVTSATTGTPTGTVSFYDGTTLLGTSTLSSGTASYTTTTLSAGSSHSLTAAYSGDVDFNGSTASATPVAVGALTFTMGVIGAEGQAGLAGSSFNFGLLLTPTYGTYPGTVQFSATGLPTGATATFSPVTIAANGGKQNVTMTIATNAASAANRPLLTGSKLGTVVLAFLLLPLAGTRRMRRQGRRFRGMLCVLLLLLAGVAATTAVTGCGTSAGFTPPKNYFITVTATSGGETVTQGVVLSLN